MSTSTSSRRSGSSSRSSSRKSTSGSSIRSDRTQAPSLFCLATGHRSLEGHVDVFREAQPVSPPLLHPFEEGVRPLEGAEVLAKPTSNPSPSSCVFASRVLFVIAKWVSEASYFESASSCCHDILSDKLWGGKYW